MSNEIWQLNWPADTTHLNLLEVTRYSMTRQQVMVFPSSSNLSLPPPIFTPFYKICAACLHLTTPYYIVCPAEKLNLRLKFLIMLSRLS